MRQRPRSITGPNCFAMESDAAITGSDCFAMEADAAVTTPTALRRRLTQW